MFAAVPSVPREAPLEFDASQSLDAEPSHNRRACAFCADRYPLQFGAHALPDGSSAACMIQDCANRAAAPDDARRARVLMAAGLARAMNGLPADDPARQIISDALTDLVAPVRADGTRDTLALVAGRMAAVMRPDETADEE
jgi:hypothetical protein